MKNRRAAALLIAALALGLAGCSEILELLGHPFDGTVWTKSEEAVLTFSTNDAVVTINGNRVASDRKFTGTPDYVTLNEDGTITITGGQNGWAHYVGTWTYDSGGTAGSLVGTVWTRTEFQTMEFDDGRIAIKNGEAFILPAKEYKVSGSVITVILENNPRATVSYSLDDTTLTISNASEQTWGARRIAGTWTKK